MAYEANTTTSGTVQEGPGTIGTRIIDIRYPSSRGLVAGTTIHHVDSKDYDDED